MKPSVESSNILTNIEKWIISDLEKSGLNTSVFPVVPIVRKQQLENFGYEPQFIQQILSTGAYGIQYPNCNGYMRLKLRQNIGDAKYLGPKGAGNHAYILPEVNRIISSHNPEKIIFITEGEKKAVKATLEGFPCIGLPGVWCFKDSDNDFLPELDDLNLKYWKVFIVFDSDITQKHNVKHAELRLAVELINRGAQVYSVRLPTGQQGQKQGFDDYLVANGEKAFRELVDNAQLTLELLIEENIPTELLLKELVRLEPIITREELLIKIAHSRGVTTAIVKKQFAKLISDEDKESKEQVETYTDEELQKAQDLLKSEHILEGMLELTERGGYVGESINKQMLFLAFTSRLMDNSISCIVKGASASGKSSLVRIVLNLFPPADVLKFSFVSAKALVHFPGSLAHKILFVQEQHGADTADYSIRTTLSEGEISISYPVKNEATGEFVTQGKVVDARGLVYVETTTQDRVHAENQTRLFDLYMDESPEQTEKILFSESMEFDQESYQAKVKIWRAAQTLLKQLTVVIPFSGSLIEPFPKGKLRARRDFKRFLALIKAHALLHQYQREIDDKGRVIATLDDLKAILPIAGKVLVDSLKELSPKQIKVIEIIKNEFGDVEFSIGELANKVPSINRKTLSRYMKAFNDECVVWNGEKGKKSRYSLINSGVPVSQLDGFVSNMLKSLESIGDKDECPQMSSMSSKDAIKDIRDNQGQNGLSPKDTNNEGELGSKRPIKDIETRKDKDLDVDSWEEEAEEFLKSEVSKI